MPVMRSTVAINPYKDDKIVNIICRVNGTTKLTTLKAVIPSSDNPGTNWYRDARGEGIDIFVYAVDGELKTEIIEKDK